MNRSIRLAGILVCLLMVHPAVSQEWTHGGPWASNIQWMSFNPHDTTEVYAVQDDGGYWISHDCGRTWRDHVTDLPSSQVKYLLFHPVSPDTMFMLARVEYNWVPFRSTDGGGTWEQFNQGLEGVDVNVFRISSVPPYRLYVGEYAREDSVHLFRYSFDGDTWELLATFPRLYPFVNLIDDIEEDPFVENRLLVSASTPGLWESLDDGATWQNILDEYFELVDFEFDPETPDHLVGYGAASRYYYGIYHSENGGHTWRSVSGFVGDATLGFL